MLIVPLFLSFWSPEKLVQQLNFNLQLQVLEQIHQIFSALHQQHPNESIYANTKYQI